MSEVIVAQAEIIEFKKQDAVIAYMAVKYHGMTVAKDGYKVVRTSRLDVKSSRCAVENLRVELKKEPFERCKLIDAEAKRLTKLLEPIEAALETEEKTEDARLAAVAKAIQEKEHARMRAIEDAKQAVLSDRVRQLGEAGVVVQDLTSLASMGTDDFEAFLKQEISLVEAEREEAAKVEALRLDEVARQAEELRIRAAELQAEQTIENERLRVEREAIEADRAEIRRQQEAINQQQATLRAAAEAEAAELRRVAREAEEDLQAKALRAKLDAMQPELERLESLLSAMLCASDAILDQAPEPEWTNEFESQFTRFSIVMRSIVRGDS